MSDRSQNSKKQVFIQLEHSDNEADDQSNADGSQSHHQQPFSPANRSDYHDQSQVSQVQTNEHYVPNEDEEELYNRLMVEIQERQDQIITLIGNDQAIPIIDANQSVINSFINDPYIRTIKTCHLLCINSWSLENQDYMFKIKKLNKEVEDLKKIKLPPAGNTENQQIAQNEIRIAELQRELNKQLETNKYQSKCMNEVDRENQQLHQDIQQLRQQLEQSQYNHKNKQSNQFNKRSNKAQDDSNQNEQIEEMSRAIDEKDIIIQTQQDRIKLLLANAAVQMNMFTKDMHIRNFNYQSINPHRSPSPKQRKPFTTNTLSSSKKSKIISKMNYKTPKIDVALEQKDVILKGVNQAQIIEELLKKKGGINQMNGQDSQKYHDLFIKLDVLNKDYIDLIKKFQELQKDNIYLMRTIEDLARNNDMMDNDFSLVYKKLKDQMNQKPIQSPQLQQNSSVHFDMKFLVSQDVEDMDQLLEYIYILFEERQYYHASRLWGKIEYHNFMQARFAKNIDYLKVVIKLKEEQIAELLKNGHQFKEPAEILNEDKINEIIYLYFKDRDDKQRENDELKARNRELAEQMEKLQTKLELLQGERDFERRKADKAKKEAEDLAKELKSYKDIIMTELQDKYEKEIGALNAEIRQLKKQIAKLQHELATANDIAVTQKSEDSGEMRIDELDDIQEMLKNRLASTKNLGEDWDELDDEEIEKRLRMLYSQFFSTDFKTSQEKIRNKNQVFKQLFQICVNDLQSLRDNIRGLKRDLSEQAKKLKEIRGNHELLRKELEQCHSYSIKLISRLQNQQNEGSKDDLRQLKVIQLLKIISTLIQDLEDKSSNLQNFKLKRNESDFDAEVDKLSREEILRLLKELSQENDALIQRAEMLTDQLMQIVQKIKQSEELNDKLEDENDKLLQQYNKLVKKFNLLSEKQYICENCLNQPKKKEKPQKHNYEIVEEPFDDQQPKNQESNIKLQPKNLLLQPKPPANHMQTASVFSFSRESSHKAQPAQDTRPQVSMTPQQNKTVEYFHSREIKEDSPKINRKIVALRHHNLNNYTRTVFTEEKNRNY
eukprot:403373461